MSLFSLLKQSKQEAPLLHPTCLYLDWPSCEAVWLTSHEVNLQNIKWHTKVNWKELGCDILIATNIATGNEDWKQPYQESLEPVSTVPFLKSHLQKSIRRSNAFKAIKTACHLDLLELLRRLSIIAWEDTLPINGYSTLIWFLAAVSNGYIMNYENFCWLLGYIHDLSLFEYYEQYPKTYEPVTLKSLRLRSLPQEGRNLCYSLMFRQAYGGTKDDKLQIGQCAQIWASRFRTQSNFIELLQRKIKYISPPIESLKPEEWLLASIDYHVNPNLLLNLAERHDSYTTEDIKEAIWHCSSSCTNKINISINLKQRNPGGHTDLYKEIKKSHLGLAKYLIEKSYS